MIKHFLWTCCFSIALSAYCNAQKIEIKPAFGGYNFNQNGKELSIRELASIMEPNPAAHALIRAAKKQDYLTTVVSSLGGALIGWNIPEMVGGDKPNWGMVAAGAALIGVAIPISLGSMGKASQAVDLYNEGLKTTSFQQKTLQIEPTRDGIGWVMRF
jgi:hypothetical protein